MGDIRIVDLKTKTDMEPEEYVPIDSQSGGTWKYDLRRLIAAVSLSRTDIAELTSAVESINTDLGNLQDQVDGNITTWYYAYEPTMENEPANTWVTDEERTNHVGDLFYNSVTGYAYRFMQEDDKYYWIKISDEDVSEALRKASEAKDTADHKRRVFTAKPYVPYDVGDLWCEGSNGDILTCIKAKKDSEKYEDADWSKLNKYTDDSTALDAKNAAQNAWDYADDAHTAAQTAWDYADDANEAAKAAGTAANAAASLASAAKSSADSAAEAAQTAWNHADEAADAAQAAWDHADNANNAATSAASAANAAGAAAKEAQDSADEALSSASTANSAANSALTQLSVVEDVVDVLSWVSEHGTYKLTEDTSIVEGKYYFIRTGSAPNYSYIVASDRTGNPRNKGYYELDSVDEAVSNYVSSHLALTNQGLWVVNDNSSYKILLSNTGLKVYDNVGNLVSTFGESIEFSSTRPQTIGNSSSYVKFYKENNVWKLAISAEEIKMDSSSVATESYADGKANAAQSAAEATAAADATAKANAAQSAAEATAAADATAKANAAEANAKADTLAKVTGFYATCPTAAGTKAKVATIVPAVTGWAIYVGAVITVKFTAANTNSAPTLNVNSTGAKPIKTYANGSLAAAEYRWPAGSTFTFTYNGTNWLMQDSTISTRLSTAETSITQTKETIELKANASDVYTKTDVDGKISQEVTDRDAAIKVSSDAITANVSKTYSTKTEVSGYISQEITDRNAAITAKANEITSSVSATYATKTSLSSVESKADSANSNLASYIASNDAAIKAIQDQVDGAIETWFYEVDPTSSNVPAKDWKTTDDKNVHLGDLYYNTKTGHVWRWQLSGSTYSWTEIVDTDAVRALADAAAAQSTANSKRRVFVAQPTTPYEIGDLWVQGTSGDLMRCQIARASGNYTASDWVKATKYTDDSELDSFKVTYSTDLKQTEDAIALRATKSEAAQMAQPNLAPYHSSQPFSLENPYWVGFNSNTNIKPTFTYMGDGWTRIQYTNAGSGTGRRDFYPAKAPNIKQGQNYTWLLEFRNNQSTDLTTAADFYMVQTANLQFWGDIVNGAKYIRENDEHPLANHRISTIPTGTDGTVYTRRFLKPAETATGGHWSNNSEESVLGLAAFTARCNAGGTIDYEFRISVYEGEYRGPYKPYAGTQLFASQSELKVTAEGITSEVSKKVGNDEIISKINQSAETVKIQASKVEIDGTAVFSSIKTSLDSNYDAKGAASAAETSAKNYADTTVIDGGRITTGTIDASKVNVTNIDASKITAGTLSANRIAAGSLTVGMLNDNAKESVLNSNIQVGGRNLIRNTNMIDLSALGKRPNINGYYNDGAHYGNAEYPTSIPVTAVEGGIRATVDEAVSTYPWIRFGTNSNTAASVTRTHGRFGLEAGKTYTWSFDLTCKLFSAKTATAARNVGVYLYFGTETAPNFALSQYIYPIRYPVAEMGEEKSAHVAFTFTIPEDSTRIYLAVRADQNTLTWFLKDDFIELRNLKLEEGNVATAWTPAPEDVDGAIAASSSVLAVSIGESIDNLMDNINDDIGNINSRLNDQSDALTGQAESLSNLSGVVDGQGASISQMNGTLDSHANSISALEETQSNINGWMQFDPTATNPALIIGRNGSQMTTRIFNDKLAFYDGESEVAYVESKQLNIENANIKSNLQIGNYLFKPHTNGDGGMSLVWNK